MPAVVTPEAKYVVCAQQLCELGIEPSTFDEHQATELAVAQSYQEWSSEADSGDAAGLRAELAEEASFHEMLATRPAITPPISASIWASRTSCR